MVCWNNLLWKAQLPPTEKLVLLYLLDRSNAEGRSWPLVDTIALETGLSRRTVLGALKRLRERGVLSWESHGRGNVYQVHPEALEGLAAVQRMHPRGATGAHRTSHSTLFCCTLHTLRRVNPDLTAMTHKAPGT